MNAHASDSRPDVTVVIVNWNGGDLLRQTLDSLYRETRRVRFETVVVDNASTDESVAAVHGAFPDLRLILLPENRGFAAANNRAFGQARGRYVLLLNSDTIVLPSTLPGLVGFLDAHPEAGCVGCRHLWPDGSLQPSIDSFPSLLKDFLCSSELRRAAWVLPFMRRHYPWWTDHDVTREVDWVNGSCLMVRREAISHTGGLDEGFFLYAEEIDWCYRMRQAGWLTFFTPDAEVVHIGGQSTRHIADRRVALLYRGQRRFYRKHYGGLQTAALHGIISDIAVVRLGCLSAVYVATLFGTRARRAGGELLTQEPLANDPATMLRAWWTILTGR